MFLVDLVVDRQLDVQLTQAKKEKNWLMSRIELGIYNLNTSVQTDRATNPSHSQFFLFQPVLVQHLTVFINVHQT